MKTALRGRVRSITAEDRCALCDCRGDPTGELDALWCCVSCEGIFHAGCSGASDDLPEHCDDCAIDLRGE